MSGGGGVSAGVWLAGEVGQRAVRVKVEKSGRFVVLEREFFRLERAVVASSPVLQNRGARSHGCEAEL